MKIGDLVEYKYPQRHKNKLVDNVGIVLYNNRDGGTLKVQTFNGVQWFVTSYCKVLKEETNEAG